MDKLLEIDQQLFLLINRDFANSFFDFILPAFRNPFFWSPFYLFIVVFLILNFKKKGLIILGFLLLTFFLSDQISSHLIKPLVERLRPCNEPSFSNYVRLLVPCGSGFSFTSSHATNHFAIAFYLIILGFQFKRWLFPVLFFWAFFISIAQVYVGVHYPFDILCGAILGSTIGIGTSFFTKKFFNFNTKNGFAILE